jgi:hypothetical protein
MKLLLTCILVLKYDTSLALRSLKQVIELDSRFLYQAHADTLKLLGRILHIESLSWMTNSRLLRTF